MRLTIAPISSLCARIATSSVASRPAIRSDDVATPRRASARRRREPLQQDTRRPPPPRRSGECSATRLARVSKSSSLVIAAQTTGLRRDSLIVSADVRKPARAQVLTEDQLDLIHDRAMTILEEIGTEVRHDGALELLAAAGQKRRGTRVRWDREFVHGDGRRRPRVHGAGAKPGARGHARRRHARADRRSGGSPFVSDLERGRRDGAYARPRRDRQDDAGRRPARAAAERRRSRPPTCDDRAGTWTWTTP